MKDYGIRKSVVSVPVTREDLLKLLSVYTLVNYHVFTTGAINVLLKDLKPLNLIIKPLNPIIKLLNLIIKPLNPFIKSLNLNIKPLNFITKPLNLIIKPLNLILNL